MPGIIRDPLARRLFAEAQEGIALFDADGELVGWNAAARAITGWDQAAAGSHDILSLPAGICEIRDGKWVDLRRSTTEVESSTLRIVLFADASAQKALTEARHQLTAGGLMDRVTQFAGPEMLHDHLARSIALARRDERSVGVIALGVDIPRMSEYVPTDELMAQLGKRILASTRGSDLAARMTERDLAVVLTAMARPGDAAVVSVRMLLSLSQPYVLAGRERSVTVSIGVASFPLHGESPESVMAAASRAMTLARADGGGHRIAA
ncbi:MAG: diguanylate cyclase [Chloroflexota bacterium]|nr:diguanylate cyclase [Chloroflexota bacterium]